MIHRVQADDWRLVLGYAGRIVLGFSVLFLVPLATSALSGEWGPALDFLLGLGLSLSVGFAMTIAGDTGARPAWIHGMVSAALSWLAVMALAAVPYALSGHFLSYLDACFDAMSGFTTTGLTLLQDLDHVSDGLNMWRHVLTFVGGQGVIVLALTFAVNDPGGGYTLYVGEGKDERLFPSVIHTAKAIWRISMGYLAMGTLAFFAAGLAIGQSPIRAALHGLWMFMSAWSTGGFAPMSQNMLYYHSASYEFLTMVFFVLGSLNFALHGAMWSGRRAEMRRNLEVTTLAVSLALFAAVACAALLAERVYPGVASLFRKGFYLLLSGHTTTGLMNVYARQFALEWGDTALLAMITVMLIGGSACSTAGGMKGLRVGLVAKAMVREARRMLAPASAVIEQPYRYHGKRILDDSVLRNALMIMALYVITFLLGSMANVAAGYPFLDSLFEAASVTGNVGLSIGVATAAMPAFLKLVYIAIMWMGRLEFMAVIALAAFLFKPLGRKA